MATVAVISAATVLRPSDPAKQNELVAVKINISDMDNDNFHPRNWAADRCA